MIATQYAIVKSIIQNSPAVKKSVRLQEGNCEKGMKFTVAAKKWLDDRLMAKIYPSETWRRIHNSPELSL